MAITASTLNQDAIYRSDNLQCRFEDGLTFVTTSITWNQGDFLCFDTSAHTIRRVAATGDAATIIGIAQQGITSGVVDGPYQGLATTNAPRAFVGPCYGVTAYRILKTGDAFNPGVKVYLADGGTTQTVSSTDPGDGNYVGLYDGLAVSSAAAGQTGFVKIGCRYPTATGGELEF